MSSAHERRQSGSGSSGSGSSRRSVHDERRQSGRSSSGSSADSCARPHVSRPIAPPASAQSAIAQTAKSASGSAPRFTFTRARGRCGWPLSQGLDAHPGLPQRRALTRALAAILSEGGRDRCQRASAAAPSHHRALEGLRVRAARAPTGLRTVGRLPFVPGLLCEGF